MGDAPFPSMTVALIESQLPGGHSPGFLVVVNEPLPTSENILNWRVERINGRNIPTMIVLFEPSAARPSERESRSRSMMGA